MNLYKPNNQRDSRFDDDYIENDEYAEDVEYIDEDEYINESVYDDSEYEERYGDSDRSQNHSVDNRRASMRYRKQKSRFSLKKIILLFLLIFAVVVFISYLMIPEKTNFLVMATDEAGTRTDTIMILSIDKTKDSFSVMSIPRDTYITVSDEMYKEMSAEYPEPGSKSMKINAVHHFSGEKSGAENLKAVVESLLSLDIHYTIKVDLDAFRYIVDAIGGVDFYVPCNMVYTDPYQNLQINLSEGMQHLNGEQAEQVVRFRSGYANADLGRVEVQQQFIQAFVDQALSFSTVVTHPFAYFNAFTNYFNTDFGIIDIFSYAFVIIGADTENIETFTLPGYAGYVGGQSVYKLDESSLDEVIANFR